MKKIMAGMLSACMVFSSLTAPVFANDTDIMLISSEENEEAYNMERALLSVKRKIPVPEDLTEFSYKLGYSGGNYSKSKYWNFTWRDKEYNKSVKVRCDEEGNILSYSIYNSEDRTSKPTYLKEELVKNATDFIKKVAPEISDKIELSKSEFSGVYSGTYLYTFERVENGIKMPDNEVTVTVNYETGEVKRFNSDWTFDVEIPSPELNISLEEAREKIGENLEMKLKYMSKTENIGDKKVVKAYLVYVPDKSYIAVDAKTGEIYDTRDEFYDMDELEDSKNAATASFSSLDMAAEEELTVEEVEKINEMKKLITKEEAILAVTSRKDVLLLDDNAKAIEAKLTQKYDYDEEKNTGYIWQLRFTDPRSIKENNEDTYRAYIKATVDAENGKILYYHSTVRSYYDSELKEWEDINVKYTSEQCQNTFENFVKNMESEKFSDTRLSDSTDTAYLLKYIDEKPVYGGYSYNYVRVNEGVDYTYNNISGDVDGITGKIYSYNVNWTDNIEFESPNGAISAKEAYNAYSEKDGFELVYEINNKHYIENNPKEDEYYDYSDLYVLEKEVRLVYRTDIYPQYISPFTGEQLDYSGTVYEEAGEKKYTDISGYWGERYIKLITDMEYSFDGDEFLPEKAITKDEWFNLLRTVGSYTDEDEYKDAKKVTKLDAVKMIINSLYLERVAKIPNIYKSSFDDIGEVQNSDIGYVALAEGLGILSGDGSNNINPNKELSRIEAVCMVLKLANIK